MVLAVLANEVKLQIESGVDKEMLDEWSEGEVCMGLFDGSVPEFDTISVGRYNTTELELEDVKE